MASASSTAQTVSATAPTQTCVAIMKLRRSTMSASAPLGRPNRNTGSVDAACTRATIVGEAVSVVIIQAAATSFIHIETLAVSQTVHSMR